MQQEPSDVETHSDAEVEVSDENETDAETILYNSDSSSESDSGVSASEIKPIFKTRQDFSSSEDYEQYVTDHVKVGSFVRFKQKDQTESTTGKVTKVNIVFIYKKNLRNKLYVNDFAILRGQTTICYLLAHYIKSYKQMISMSYYKKPNANDEILITLEVASSIRA